MSKYNTKISQLGGLFVQTASEIMNDPELKTGEKHILLQRLVADIAPATKAYASVDKSIKDWAKLNLKDGDVTEYEGAEVSIVYNAPPKPTLSSDLLYKDLERVYGEQGYTLDKDQYLVQGEPAKRVVIQSILKK